jgi:hypothetical protein
MRRNRGWQFLMSMVLLVILSSVVTSAQAAPITIPDYTVTDLGAGLPTFSTDARGNGVLNAPNGYAYAFPQRPSTALTPGQGIMANFPQLEAPPSNFSEDSGNSASDFSRVTNAIMNSHGVVAAMNAAGIDGHNYTEDEYLIQRNADGSWGQPVLAYSSGTLFGGAGGGFRILGLSNTNIMLISNDNPGSNLNNALVYNVSTHALTDLFASLSTAGLSYADVMASAIDDNGQILLSAERFNPAVGFTPTNLLLSPDGLASAPLEVPAPEPGTLAIGLLAIAGFAAHCLRERRRIS